MPARRPAGRSRPRRRRRRRTRRGPGGRAPRRTRAAASSRARRPRGTTPASPARSGSARRRGTRTGGRTPPSRPVVLGDVAVQLLVGALEPGAGVRAGTAVARARRRTPRRGRGRGSRRLACAHTRLRPGHRAEVAEQPRLHVLGQQRLAQQRVGHQVDLADREVVRGPPPRVHAPQLVAASGPSTRRGGAARAGRVAPLPAVSSSAAVSPPMLAVWLMTSTFAPSAEAAPATPPAPPASSPQRSRQVRDLVLCPCGRWIRPVQVGRLRAGPWSQRRRSRR